MLHLKQAKQDQDVPALALDSAHAVAFHTGLGAPSYPSTSTPLKGYLNEHNIAAYAANVYSKQGIALVSDGASAGVLSKWTEQFFKDVKAAPGSDFSNFKPSTYYGGEQRTAHGGGNSLVIAFPGFSLGAFKPEIAVLEALLGGHSSVKWAPGFTLLAKATAHGATASAANLSYSDAGLFTIQINGAAQSVRKTAEEAIKALKGVAEGTVSKEDLTKAISKAKFDALVSSESGSSTLLSAGSGIVHNGKPFEVVETVKGIESVSAEKLKSVCIYAGTSYSTIANRTRRLLRRLSMERLRWRLLVISLRYHSQRSWVSKHKRLCDIWTCTNHSARYWILQTSIVPIVYLSRS